MQIWLRVVINRVKYNFVCIVVSVNEINFEKLEASEVDTLGIQYDLESVMHYGNFAFTKNGKHTVQSIEDPQKRLGNVNGLSNLDVVKINALYGCSSKSKAAIC